MFCGAELRERGGGGGDGLGVCGTVGVGGLGDVQGNYLMSAGTDVKGMRWFDGKLFGLVVRSYPLMVLIEITMCA